ncbi:MAG TPA: hypothetical protein VGJ15_12345 [Pirellulales bacterium]|jgi:hypothetical protein
MIRFCRFVVACTLIGLPLIGASGCSMFNRQPQRPKKEVPDTVEGWMKQQRVPPTKINE